MFLFELFVHKPVYKQTNNILPRNEIVRDKKTISDFKILLLIVVTDVILL